MDDWTQDPTAKRWIKHVLDDMVPKMEGSAVVCSIVPDTEHGEGDVKFWVELGAAIMMNKPIVIVSLENRPVSDKLRLIADEIVFLPDGVTPSGSDDVANAIGRVIKREDEGRE